MPRKPLLRADNFPYHVTARVNNREVFPVGPELAWELLTNELYLQCLCLGAQVNAFVLMPNHFHLIVSTPEAPIDTLMREFMRSTTKIINARAGRSGHLYGGPYYSCLIREPLYYAHAVKYVYRNPVKANLCTQVENWTHGTISGLTGYSVLPLKIFRPPNGLDSLVPAAFEPLLEWLNCPHKKEEANAIQQALRRKEFKIPVNPKTRKTEKLRAPNAP